MPKKRSHRGRGSGRFTPKAPPPASGRGPGSGLRNGGPGFRDGPWSGPTDEELAAAPDDLMADVREAMASHPVALLHLASTLLAVAEERPSPFDPGPDDGEAGSISKDELLATFFEVDDLVETSALLAVLAALDGDELLAGRVRRELDRRGHPVPMWTRSLDRAEITGTQEMVHTLGDGDNVLIGVRLGSGHELTQVIYIDHNMGTVVKDAFALDESLGEAVARMRGVADDADTTIRPLSPADARARVAEAVSVGELMWPPFETDTWPGQRPLVRWITRLLPEGGQGYRTTEWTEAALDGLAEQFFASPLGQAVDDEVSRGLIDPLLWFASAYGQAKPLNWSPVRVEILLTDWFPRKVIAPADELDALPRLLRALIRFAGDERGLGAHLVQETLEAVDRWEGEYRSLIRTDRLQGPEALIEMVRRRMLAPGMAGTIVFDDDDDDWDDWDDFDDAWDDEWDDDDEWDWSEEEWRRAFWSQTLADLARAAGGEAALDALGTEPLPDEDIDWAGVGAGDQARVRAVAELVDRCCQELLDPAAASGHEHRTAARRLLARMAASAPDALARGRTDTAAAAICWVVAKANGTLDPHHGGLTAGALMDHFGLKGSVSNRASTLLRAIDIDGHRFADRPLLDSADYLISARREAMRDRRDQARAALEALDAEDTEA